MAFVAVDKNGSEFIFSEMPQRWNHLLIWGLRDSSDTQYVELPSGSIKKLIGRELSWDDDPVELT